MGTRVAELSPGQKSEHHRRHARHQGRGQRLSYQSNAAVQEWFVNDQRGLEHGLTVAERPAAPVNDRPATLNFVLTTRGTLDPHIAADAQSILFKNAGGTTVVNYAGLKVWDADGRVLISRFEAEEERTVRIVVDIAVRDPLTVDPTTGVNSMPNDNVSGAGAAYVFVRSTGVWTERTYLKPAVVVGLFPQAGDPRCDHYGQGFIAPIRTLRAGNVMLPAARLMVTFPSSSG